MALYRSSRNLDPEPKTSSPSPASYVTNPDVVAHPYHVATAPFSSTAVKTNSIHVFPQSPPIGKYEVYDKVTTLPRPSTSAVANFRSQVPRFDAETDQKIGPGSYKCDLEWVHQSKRISPQHCRKASHHRERSLVFGKSSSSIPLKPNTAATPPSEKINQAPPPGTYDPRDEAILKSLRTGYVSYSKNHEERPMNIVTSNGIPGPGDYKIKTDSIVVQAPEKQSYSFLTSSKREGIQLPSFSQIVPGPGTYYKDQPPTNYPSSYDPSIGEGFGTHGDRKLNEDNRIFPYPGPGAYCDSLKLRDYVPLKTPFASTSLRFKDPSEEERRRGPGLYEEVDPSILAHRRTTSGLNSSQTFGTKSGRFVPEPTLAGTLIPKDDHELMPAPNAYSLPTAFHPPPGQNSAFLSKSYRFGRPLEKRPVTAIVTKAEYQEKRWHSASFAAVSMNTTANRFIYPKDPMVPGAGAYDPSFSVIQGRLGNEGREKFVGVEERWKKVTIEPTPGPAQYNVNDAFIKRSFNVTMT